MHATSGPLLRLGDALATIVIAVCAGYALGELFIWLWAPTPTPDNSSPPPEAFLFFWGALIGFLVVVVARVFVVPLWLRRRRKFG